MLVRSLINVISSSTHGSVLSWSYKSCDYFRYPADVRAVDAILSLIVFPFIKFCSVVMGVRQWCAVGGWLVAVCLFAARTAPGSAASDVVGVHRMSGLLRTSPHPDGERPAASSTAMPRQRLILLTASSASHQGSQTPSSQTSVHMRRHTIAAGGRL